MKVIFDRDVARNALLVWVVAESGDGSREFALPTTFTFAKYNEGERPDPTLTIPATLEYSYGNFIEALINGLRDGGFLDKEGPADAIRYHLEDMRRLVFGEKNK